MAIPPRQPCPVALHQPIESPAPRALSNLLMGTSSSLVAFPGTSLSAAPPSRAARTPAPPPRAPATAPPVPSLVRRHHVPRTSTTTRTSCPHFRRLRPRPTILRYDPGLAASPPVRYTLKVARREISLPFAFGSSISVRRQGPNAVERAAISRRSSRHTPRLLPPRRLAGS